MSAEYILPALTNVENVIAFLGSVGTFLTVVALAVPFAQRDALSPRLKARRGAS